ncbi:PAS domain S-box protein [Lentibacillus lipolyticus]|nr:PAS domain S-box protein [Lentibacillus lipolyticus]
MHGFITVWDKEGSIIHVSDTIEKILGYTTTDLLGTRWFEKISPENTSYIQEVLDRKPNQPQAFYISIQDVNGNILQTENIAAHISCEDQEYYYAVSTKDITAKKEAEEMMIRSEKMSVAGQLAAGIAHEIRNPLTSLKGFLQLLQAGVNRKEEYYQIMVDEIEKMEAITSELLFISKPMTDHKDWENLPELIDDVITLLKPQAKLKNIVLTQEGEDKLDVYCDRSQIKQVFINILKNGIEAMEASGCIQVYYCLLDQMVQIDIIDQGPGVPDEFIHKLGEPFFTTKESGTGLGIMITKQILDRHGGTLQIMHNKDEGSTFRILLPRTEN